MSSAALVKAPKAWRIVPCPACGFHEARLVPPSLIDDAAFILCTQCWTPFGDRDVVMSFLAQWAERGARKRVGPHPELTSGAS